ncbi:hypothetical protein D3C72_987220 [compost metagenome]
MQVRAGGPAGRADGADGLALAHALAGLHVDAAQVGVGRLLVVAVVDDDDVAVAALRAGEIDRAITDRAHRGARGRRVVDAVVLAPAVQNRMHAHREAAGHARELDRRSQVGLAQAVAVRAVVAALLARARGLEPDGLVDLAVVLELGREHAAAAQRLAVGFEGLVDHGEAVALAQRAHVDVAREDVGQLARHGVGNARVVGGGEQRAADGAAGQARARRQHVALGAGDKTGGRALDDETLEAAVGVGNPAGAELLELVFLRGFGRHGAAHAREQRHARLGVAAHEGGGGGVGDAQALHQRLGRVAGARDVGAEQREAEVLERRRLVGEGHRRGGFEHLLDGEVGRVGTERGDREGAGAEQHRSDRCGDLLGVRPECVGHAGSEKLLGGKDAVDQTVDSNSGSAGPCCKAQCVQGGRRRCGKKAPLRIRRLKSRAEYSFGHRKNRQKSP